MRAHARNRAQWGVPDGNNASARPGFSEDNGPRDASQFAGSPEESSQFASSHGLDSRAFQGPIGEFVLKVGPHTEASQAAVLLTMLTSFGVAVGNGPYVMVGDSKQHAALFTVIAGKTAKARKGTSGSVVARVMDRLDSEHWTGLADLRNPPTLGGFGSGETLIDEIRDSDGDDDIEAPTDRRLLIYETEFASVLRRIGRDSSILGPTLRTLWDGTKVTAKSRGTGKRTASDYHVGAVGHITLGELATCISTTEIQSGTSNRILWLVAERARRLPRGGNTPEWLVEETAAKLRDAYDHAVGIRGHVPFTDSAYALWDEFYEQCAEDDPEGLLGDVIARAEANVIRLSLIYALADGKGEIGLEHLSAALAVWDFCRQSAQSIFGHRTGNPQLDRLLKALCDVGSKGMSRTEIIRHVFSNHIKSSQLTEVLALGEERGLIKKFKRDDISGACYRLANLRTANS